MLRSGTVRRSDVPMKDRNETPALRARSLRSYVSAAFHSERERVRQRYITAPDRPAEGRITPNESEPAIGI